MVNRAVEATAKVYKDKENKSMKKKDVVIKQDDYYA